MALLLSAGAFADEKSQALLSALQNRVAGWGDYRVEFTVTIGDETLGGSFEVSGESYHVVTPEIELFCDGTTKWEVNIPVREVAVDRVDPLDRTVMANPTKLFDFLDGSYTHRYVGPALVDGVQCERIELTENTAGGGSASASASTLLNEAAPNGQKVDVFISTATGLPVRIGYTIGMMSTEAAVDIARVTPRVTLGAAFRYDEKRYPGFETIDFR
jgi:hypothetical protein